MQLKKGEIVTVKVEKLAFGDKGIGYIDNNESKFVVFIEDAVPGDTVEAVLKKIKKNYAEAKLNKVVKKSKIRIEPRCKHFENCGGCSLQNIPYEKQLEIKESQIKETLEHIGGFKKPKIKKIIGCENPWFYRNKMEFSFRADKEEGIKVGLHPKHYRYEVFQIEECFLESEDTGALIREIRDFAVNNNLSVYNFNENKGLLRCVVIREGKRTKKRLINLITSHEEFTKKEDFISLLTQTSGFAPADSIYITQQITQKGKKTEFDEHHLYGEHFLEETMQLEDGSKLYFNIPPSAFFQPNTLQAEKLYSIVLSMSSITEKDTVYDLFCGTGTIGLFCAHRAKKIIGVDINPAAISIANANAKKNLVKNAEFICGNTNQVVKDLNQIPDAIIVDPPRSGLGEKLCSHIIDIKSPVVIYVSCNPSTLARDLQSLCHRTYSLESVQPLDMFPHTHHIETVCKLVLQK